MEARPPPLALLTALLVFPQIVETVYSPALVDIGHAFSVSPQVAAQTLSCYFASFAAGVLSWGWLSDRWGRRPALLAGLAVYAAGSLAALFAHDFAVLLFARIVSAFGAAAGSVVTQTMLRDRLRGGALAQAFAQIGVALALSPAIGLLSGSALVQRFGYRGVFVALLALAGLLLIGCAYLLRETRADNVRTPAFSRTIARMARDPQIALAALLIAAQNVGLFSFYALAPSLFHRAGLPAGSLVWGGVALAVGSLTGGRGGAALRRRGAGEPVLLGLGLAAGATGAALSLPLSRTIWCVPAMSLVSLGFALVVPVVLGRALAGYSDQRGSAGAILGLAYYTLIAIGLALAGWGQNLGLTLAVCAAGSALCGWRYCRHLA
ncbi:MFS transporter [Chitinasiproducens palmae]|nr:MFS transporter [Chitinasiproducens palmae]